MKPTPLPNLYRAAGFAAPTSRRKAAEHIDKIKQTVEERHAFSGARTPQKRLKSRNSFLGTVKVEPPEDFPLTEICPSGHLLDFNTWESLNRIRTGVAPVKNKYGEMGQNRRWRSILWLWRGTRYGASPVMQGLPAPMHPRGFMACKLKMN
jgi:hypothetical protein